MTLTRTRRPFELLDDDDQQLIRATVLDFRTWLQRKRKADAELIKQVAEARRLDDLELKMPGLSLKTKERAEDILEVLEGDPLTTDEIAVLLDGKHKTNHLATTLKQLVKIGIVQGRLDDAPSPRDRRLVWWRESRD